MLYGISSDGDVHQVPYSIGSTPTKAPQMTEDWKPFLYATNGLCFANIRRKQNLWEANQRLIEK
jgi:hypothetical protein